MVLSLFFFILSHAAVSQRKYYEYNNPEALKLTKKRIDMLTSTEWNTERKEIFIRGDHAVYNSFHTLTYNTDGTFADGGTVGNWRIKYKRYLVHTVPSKEKSHSVMGIYSVTSLDEGTLTLTKIHSSNRDMITRLSLTNLPKYLDSLQVSSTANPLSKVKIFQDGEPGIYVVNAKRFTLPVDQIGVVDSLAMAFIKAHRKTYSPTQEISSIQPYFRQYIGYEDGDGNKVILLNAFCNYNNRWKTDIIKNKPNDSCNFRIYINLTKKECFGFHVND